MSISFFSAVMAVTVFDALVALLHVLRQRTNFVLCWSPLPLLFAALLGFTRLLMPLDFPFVFTIESHRVLPSAMKLLKTPVCGMQVRMWLVLTWFAVAVILLAAFACRLVRDERMLRRLAPVLPNSALNADLVPEQLLQRVVITDVVKVPCTCGLLQARILLPASATALNAWQLQAILMHEDQHRRYGDLWIKLAVNIFVRVLWWNPVNRLLLNSVDQVLELRCDSVVVKHMTRAERLDYALTLLAIAKHRTAADKQTVLAQLVNRNATQELQQRIVVLTDGVNPPAWRIAVSTVVLLALFCISYLFILQPYIPAPESEGAMHFTADNTYILQIDEKYFLYCNNEQFYEITEETALILCEEKTVPLFRNES